MKARTKSFGNFPTPCVKHVPCVRAAEELCGVLRQRLMTIELDGAGIRRQILLPRLKHLCCLGVVHFLFSPSLPSSRTTSIMSPTLHCSALHILAVNSPEMNSPRDNLAKVDEDAPIARRRSFFVMSLSISSFQSFLYDALTLFSYGSTEHSGTPNNYYFSVVYCITIWLCHSNTKFAYSHSRCIQAWHFTFQHTTEKPPPAISLTEARRSQSSA